MSAEIVSLIPPAPSTRLDFALRYAELGWHVFPAWWIADDGACACGLQCTSPGKHPIGPLVPNGQDNATTDAAKLRKWWRSFPHANVAIHLGPSKLCAVDVDPRNGGDYTIEELEARHGSLESDLLQYTGGGGEHRVFRMPEALNLPGQLGKGVDLKLNGYIIVEPSNHKSGKHYVWEASSSPLEGAIASPLPDWLRDLARAAYAPTDEQPAPAHDAELEAQFRHALEFIPADDRDVWLRVGFALHSEIGGPTAFDMWAAWSRTSTKFDPVDQRRTWRGFKRRGLAGVNRGTLFRYAQDAGWNNPGTPLAQVAPVQLVVANDAPLAEPVVEITVDGDLHTVPGALGLVVDWINGTARKPQPLFAVQAALALGSAIAGRRFCTDNGNWPALYFLNVGPSGCGKEHAKYTVETILEAAGLGRLIGVSRYASEAGLISSLIERPVQFSCLDEFGKFLQTAAVANNHLDRNTIKGLLEVWGRCDGVVRPTAYSTAGVTGKHAEELAKRLVRKPSLTLLALSTPSTLFEALTSDAVADGFLNRFLTVYATNGRQLARQVANAEPPALAVEWIGRLRARGQGNLAAVETPHDQEPTPVVIAIERGARAAFDAFETRMFARMAELDEEGLADMLMRSTETAMRLGLVVALSCDAGAISRQHAEWACRYIETHAERNLAELRQRIADGPFNALCKAIHQAAIAAGGRGVTERDLDKNTRKWRSAPARMRLDALGQLEREGKLARKSMTAASGRGRARTAYVALADEQTPTNADTSVGA